MKTTLDIPDSLFRKAKARAAERGQSLKDLVTEALHAKLEDEGARPENPRWMAGFGKLRRLHKETARIQSVIDADLRSVEPEDRA